MKLSTMPGSHPSLNPDVEGATVRETASTPSRNLRLYRYTGYGLFLLALADFLYLLLPLQLLNPVWEYKFVSDLVRLVPVPLLALVLIFQGRMSDRGLPEKQVVRLLSWLTLVISMFFFLLIPLTTVNTLRIHRFNNEQVRVQLSQKQTQLDATQAQLNDANPEQLQQLMALLKQQGNVTDLPPHSQTAKTQVLDWITRARESNQLQAQQAQLNLRQNLLKNSFKLTVQSFIAAVMFIMIWRLTAWARSVKPTRHRVVRMTPQHSDRLALLKRLKTWWRSLQRSPRRRRLG